MKTVLKMKKQVTCGIFICAMLVVLVAMSVPAGAVNAPIDTGAGQTQEESTTEPEIKLETPSAITPQSHGMAEIEECFPTIDSSVTADGENGSDSEVSKSMSKSGQELPIVYERQQDGEMTGSEASTGTTPVGHSWKQLLFIAIPIIIILLVIVTIRIKKIKNKENVEL